MGSPKKPRKKYKKPLVVWQRELIDEQKELIKEYGLKNKKEIWRTEGFLKQIRDQAKKLIATESEQSQKEKEQLVTKLVGLGLLKSSSKIEDILTLTIKDILERRLQTVVQKKDISKSIKQSRQFIVHGHIGIKEEKINVPSYLVPVELENKITFNPASKLSNEQHPERVKEKSKKEMSEKKEKRDETDIFVKDPSEEKVKAEVEKVAKEAEKKAGTKPLEKPTIPIKKEEIQKVDEITPTENKTRENEDKSPGKEN
ncbi:MAG: 30S ribosomal protein S4 [Nanoarchaeota archaeon]|nr:30S ribosomal protein S4 [Nanoarchaeota archaeon]